MVDILNIVEFLTEERYQHGVFIFLDADKRKKWLTDYAEFLQKKGCVYSSNGNQWRGPKDSYLLLIVYTGAEALMKRLKGYTFSRFWSLGDLPKYVVKQVLTKCQR
jgi:hypothetical protein